MGSRTHGVWANDGGKDAPLTARGQRRYHWFVGGLIEVGVLAVFLLR
jgi:hypothetical protein